MSHWLPQQQTTTPWSAFAHDLRHVLKNFYRQLTSIRWSFTRSELPPLSPHLRRDIGLPMKDETHIRDHKIWNDPVSVEIRRIW